MASQNKNKFAQNEIEVAHKMLQKYPDSEKYKERIGWWNAYLGNYEEAEKYAVTEKVRQYIKLCKTR